ncbi:unnamed protein product, partial [Closterium sp. NIES-53]
LILGTTTPLNSILDRNVIALYLSTAPAEAEAEAEAEADEEEEVEANPREGPMLCISDETEAEATAHHTRYLRIPGVRTDDDLWHQRLNYPSHQTFNTASPPRSSCLALYYALTAWNHGGPHNHRYALSAPHLPLRITPSPH